MAGEVRLDRHLEQNLARRIPLQRDHRAAQLLPVLILDEAVLGALQERVAGEQELREPGGGRGAPRGTPSRLALPGIRTSGRCPPA